MIELVFGSLLVLSFGALIFLGKRMVGQQLTLKQQQRQLRDMTTRFNRLRDELQQQETVIRAESARIGQRTSAIFLKIKDVISSLEIDEICRHTLDILQRFLQARQAQVFLRTDDGEKLQVIQEIDVPSGTRPLVGLDETTLIGWCAVRQVSFHRQKVEEEQSLMGLVGKGAFDTQLCAPLVLPQSRQLIGVLNLEQAERRLTSDDRHLFQLVASVLEMALTHAVAYDKKRREGTRLLREKEEIKNIASLYVSSQVMDSILEDRSRVELGGRSATLTIMATDVRAFSRMAERFSAAQVVEILNDYFTIMGQIVQEHGGYLDKFIGDAMMILFGLPERRADDERRAVRTAIEMQTAVGEFVEMWKERLGHEFDFGIGIGISSGEVIVGNIGSLIKMDYTAIGDPVNTALRLEANCPASCIYISEEIYRCLDETVEADPLGKIKVKGKDQLVEAYRICCGQKPVAPR